MEARLEAEIEEQQGTIDALSKRCKHYREAYVKEKAKSEHLKTRKHEEKRLRQQTEQRIQTELEEKDAIIQEAHLVIDELKGQLKVSQVNYAAVLKAHNELQGEVAQLRKHLWGSEQVYEKALDEFATMQAIVLRERDMLKSVNTALVEELRRRDRAHLDDDPERPRK